MNYFLNWILLCFIKVFYTSNALYKICVTDDQEHLLTKFLCTKISFQRKNANLENFFLHQTVLEKLGLLFEKVKFMSTSQTRVYIMTSCLA